LRFGTKGSNGTNNTFMLEMLDNKNALNIDDKTSGLRIEAKLYKGDGNYVGLDEVEWELINGNKNYFSLESNNKSSICTIKLNNELNDIPTDNYAILKASISYNTGGNFSPKLEAYLPIPIKANPCIDIGGIKEVYYNS
jgi:hypothetical protein